MNKIFHDRGKEITVSQSFYDWLASCLEPPKSTIFCAVWSEDPKKEVLLRRHAECVKAQTSKPFPLYVFEKGDLPPDWFDLPFVTSNKALSIYEAWDLAVRMSPSDLVQNLNLDDVLYPNANSVLVDTLIATHADGVCGEWLVIGRDDEMEFLSKRVSTVAEIFVTRFDPAWPPTDITGAPLRLGSGTGERGTFGPSILWRRSSTGSSYPYRFKNGNLIRSMGDAIFWDQLKRSGKTIIRLPAVIGEYFSNPGSQAEFRENSDAENIAFGIEWEIVA